MSFKSQVKRKMVNAANNRIIPRPVQFEADIRYKKRIRYHTNQNNGVANYALLRSDLLNTLVMSVSSIAGNNYRILSGIKLASIEIWSPANVGSSGSNATCSVEWTSTYGPSSIKSDTSMGVEPAYVHTSPPPNSLASFWSISGSGESDVIAFLTVPFNSVLDIVVDCIVQNGEPPVLVTTSAAGVIGTVYTEQLDFNGSGYITPTSYPTLV
jgi:hypothetical protein